MQYISVAVLFAAEGADVKCAAVLLADNHEAERNDEERTDDHNGIVIGDDRGEDCRYEKQMPGDDQARYGCEKF